MFGANAKKPGPAAAASAHTAAPPVEPVNRFEKPRREEPAPDACVQNVVGKGTVIEGNILADGDLVIEGVVRGDVSTKTRLVVGVGAVVEGNILADHAEIAGQVRGTVQATGLLAIRASCVIDGDVITKNLNVESGSTFHGRFQVGGKVENVKPAADPAFAKCDPVLVGAKV